MARQVLIYLKNNSSFHNASLGWPSGFLCIIFFIVCNSEHEATPSLLVTLQLLLRLAKFLSAPGSTCLVLGLNVVYPGVSEKQTNKNKPSVHIKNYAAFVGQMEVGGLYVTDMWHQIIIHQTEDSNKPLAGKKSPKVLKSTLILCNSPVHPELEFILSSS